MTDLEDPSLAHRLKALVSNTTYPRTINMHNDANTGGMRDN